MKYEKEYLDTESKEDFIILLLDKYDIKQATAERRYYDLKKTVNKTYKNKYEKEYLETNNKIEFVKLVLKRYKIKQASAERRFYDLRKIVDKRIKKQVEPEYSEHEKAQPNMFKMQTYKDLKDYYGIVPRHILMRHGFNTQEINWLEDNGKM